MSKHTIAVTLEMQDYPTHATLTRVRDIAEAIEELVLDRFAPDNAPNSIEAPFRFDRTNGPFVMSLQTGPGEQAGA